jgi:hypothetical protein
MKKYKEYPYAIKPDATGGYYGIVFTSDGKDIIYKSMKFRREYNVYLDVTRKIDEIIEKSEQS